MKLPSYTYLISDAKYEARINFFKYTIGLFSALIPGAVITFERVANLVGMQTLSLEQARSLYQILILFSASIVCSLLTIAFTYHHKHYFSLYLKQHQQEFKNATQNKTRPLFRLFVIVEFWLANIEYKLVMLFSTTWFIPGMFGILKLMNELHTILELKGAN